MWLVNSHPKSKSGDLGGCRAGTFILLGKRASSHLIWSLGQDAALSCPPGSSRSPEPPALMCAKLLELCLTLCDPMDCSPPGSSVHGILQARILEWVERLSLLGPGGEAGVMEAGPGPGGAPL